VTRAGKVYSFTELPWKPKLIIMEIVYIEEAVNTKFIGLKINNQLNWKNRIKQIIPKLNGAYYAFRSMVHISKVNTFT